MWSGPRCPHLINSRHVLMSGEGTGPPLSERLRDAANFILVLIVVLLSTLAFVAMLALIAIGIHELLKG